MMQKRFKSLFFLLLTCLVMASCQAGNGENGISPKYLSKPEFSPIKSALKEGRKVVLQFYEPSSSEGKKLRKIAKKLEEKYQDEVTFVPMDVTSASIKDFLSETAAPVMPGMMFIDSNGNLKIKHTGCGIKKEDIEKNLAEID